MTDYWIATGSLTAIMLVILIVHWLARPHSRMYAEIRERCADIACRAAVRSAVYDQSSALIPEGGQATTGAATPDAAPVAALPRTRVSWPPPTAGRHRAAA